MIGAACPNAFMCAGNPSRVADLSVWVDVPQETRRLMTASVNQRCAETPEQQASYSAFICLDPVPRVGQGFVE